MPRPHVLRFPAVPLYFFCFGVQGLGVFITLLIAFWVVLLKTEIGNWGTYFLRGCEGPSVETQQVAQAQMARRRRFDCKVFDLLGGSWVVLIGVISRVTIVITHIRGLITPLITTLEPPSR